jgi:hypothetical protein
VPVELQAESPSVASCPVAWLVGLAGWAGR